MEQETPGNHGSGDPRVAADPSYDPSRDPKEIASALTFVEMRRQGGQLVPVIGGQPGIRRARNKKNQRIKAFTVACGRCRLGHVFEAKDKNNAWAAAHVKFLTRGLCLPCLTTIHTIFSRLECGTVEERGGKFVYVGKPTKEGMKPLAETGAACQTPKP